MLTRNRLVVMGKNLGVVDGYLEKREERKKKERAPPKAAFYQYEKAKERSKGYDLVTGAHVTKKYSSYREFQVEVRGRRGRSAL